MKTFKAIMYDIGIVASTILSMLLMVALVLTTVLSFSMAVLKTDKVEEIVENINYTELIEAEIDKSMDKNIQGMDDKVIKELLKTEMMEEIIELCIENIFDKLEGKESKKVFSVSEVKKIGNRYDDEIQELLEKHYDKAAGLSDEKLEELTDKLIDTYANTIVEMAPTTESLGLTDEAIEAISDVKNGTYFWIAVAITAVLSLLIFVVLIKNFKGLIWLGIDYFIMTVTTFIASFFTNGILRTLVDGTVLNTMDISSVAGSISVNMIISSVVMLVFSVIYIVLFIVFKKVKKKKMTQKTVSTQAAQIAQEIQEVSVSPVTVPVVETESVTEILEVVEATNESI